MRFATASKFDGDTIKLKIYETSPMYHQELNILIVKNEFQMTYNYDMSGASIERKIETKQQSLIVEKTDFEAGRILSGKISFVGCCLEGCSEKSININGYFKTEIK